MIRCPPEPGRSPPVRDRPSLGAAGRWSPARDPSPPVRGRWPPARDPSSPVQGRCGRGRSVAAGAGVAGAVVAGLGAAWSRRARRSLTRCSWRPAAGCRSSARRRGRRRRVDRRCHRAHGVRGRGHRRACRVVGAGTGDGCDGRRRGGVWTVGSDRDRGCGVDDRRGVGEDRCERTRGALERGVLLLGARRGRRVGGGDDRHLADRRLTGRRRCGAAPSPAVVAAVRVRAGVAWTASGAGAPPGQRGARRSRWARRQLRHRSQREAGDRQRQFGIAISTAGGSTIYRTVAVIIVAYGIEIATSAISANHRRLRREPRPPMFHEPESADPAYAGVKPLRT